MAKDSGNASPAEWVMRVRSLKAKRDIKSAIEACRQGLQTYPESIDLLYTHGELRVNFYNLVKKPEHLKMALISFEKLLKINPSHYMANLAAAQIYLKGRAYDRSERKLNAILENSPNDPKAMKIRQALQNKMASRARLEKKILDAKPDARPVEETRELEVESEEKIETEKLEGLKEAEQHQYEGLIDRLSHFSKLDGMVSIRLIDPAGVAIKNMFKVGKASENLSSTVADLFRTSGSSTRKIGLGNFQQGMVCTPEVNIVIVNVFYAILVVVLETDTDISALKKRINRYVEDLV